MTREVAAAIIEWKALRCYPGDDITISAEDIEAMNVAISALRGSGWLDTAIDKPTDPHETIIVQDNHGNVYTAPGWIVRDFPGTHPRWMHLPKVPGSEARKQPGEAEG